MFEGFIVKSIASFDDTLTRIPVIIQLTRTKAGRVAFSIGTLLALTAILVLAIFFSFLLDLIPYRRQVVSALIFILALLVYFDVFISASNRQIESKFLPTSLSTKDFNKLVSIGFVVSFVTYLDDSIVLVPLFFGDHLNKFLAVVGIYLAAIVQILAVIYFGEKLAKIKFKKEIASGALVLLSVLVFIGVV